MTGRHRVLGLITAGMVMLAGPAWATVGNVKSFKEAYPEKDAKATTCKVCHTVGAKLNLYGEALAALPAPANPKALTVDDFRAAEAGDADSDGASNGEELNAGTNPAEAASTPVAGQSSSLPRPSDSLQQSLASLIVPSAWAAETVEDTDTKPAAQAEMTPVAEYVGTETCAACHTKQFKEFTHSTHARISVPGEGVGAQGCETCHGPGSLHVDAGGGKGVGGLINPRKDPSVCFSCHLDKKAELRLPYHHPILEGKMSCSDCHSAHGEEVRPWSATTLEDINEACFKCHKDQRGPFVNEHEALRESCATCHKVHGSIHEKMLIARDSNLCLRCHTQTNFPSIGASGHANRLNQGTCYSAGCHTAVHGSQFDEHLRY